MLTDKAVLTARTSFGFASLTSLLRKLADVHVCLHAPIQHFRKLIFSAMPYPIGKQIGKSKKTVFRLQMGDHLFDCRIFDRLSSAAARLPARPLHVYQRAFFARRL